MKRTYLALAGMVLVGGAMSVPLAPRALAASLFNSRPVDASRFAVLARPVGDNGWTLLVLEQVQARPLCWGQRQDGLIDPALNRFDYTGICSRYLDSNGYSLRVAEEDLATRYRMQVQQVGNDLLLQATAPSEPTVLVVGRGQLPLRDRDGFVALQLEPGWELQRRAYRNQTLNHLYFAHSQSLGQLLAEAGGTPRSDPRPLASPFRIRTASLREQPGEPSPLGAQSLQPGRSIALQVIPFRE